MITTFCKELESEEAHSENIRLGKDTSTIIETHIIEDLSIEATSTNDGLTVVSIMDREEAHILDIQKGELMKQGIANNFRDNLRVNNRMKELKSGTSFPEIVSTKQISLSNKTM